MSKRRVVVTGLGIVSPVGSTVESAWANVVNGVSGIAPITRFDTTDFPCRFGGAVKDFQLDKYLSAKEARRMDEFMHYGIAAGVDAMADSGLDLEKTDLDRVGVITGSGIGGLSTIEEKAMGNIAKTGTKPVVGALESAEMPDSGPGLYFMDTSSAAAECITLMAAAGAVVHLFPTGQGNVIGNPIEPVIKLTANPVTVETMSEHVDLDCSGLLRREYDLTTAGDKLMEVIDRTINGRLASAEVMGHREFVLTRLYPSA